MGFSVVKQSRNYLSVLKCDIVSTYDMINNLV